ncbi:anaphase promoting complex subunit [Saccharomycopsis crataegensis]|uniref:Anaphase promoting complex subunit n=1 Tax=Saccharomycopsis crataegensis TaxID=43959 RepID=A0AAV5QT77_9ASCO|nr:anaphase promoting complex subunit [Saccharomycopsis crataegensis]
MNNNTNNNISRSANNSTLAISPLLAHAQRRVSENYSTPPNQLFHTPINPEILGHHNRHQTHVPSPLQQTPQRFKFNDQSSLASSSSFNDNSVELDHNNTSPLLQPLSQAEKLRLWRHDALMQHHYETACYIGDKVYSLTNDPNDAFWLAQVHYATGNYIRAHQLLSTDPQMAFSVSCRYLNALCLTKINKWEEALDVIGEDNPFKNDGASNIKNQDGGIKLESSMCYLRGLIYSNQNNFDKAKECYKEAVLIDVKCYEAFNELIKNNFITPNEEWELLNSLNFEELEDNGELIKNLYITRLNKYINPNKIQEAEAVLDEEYNLIENNDILISKANLLFIQCKFQQCLEVCEKVLENDEFNFQALPIYLSALHELGGKNKLFLIANRLAELYPKNCTTWLAIGIYYLSINKISDARKFFSKASLTNPNFGQAWIGFAHTFAAEGEHEQAISAYSTAARLFPGTHLPNLFLGMQYLQMNNLSLAEEYMLASYEICPSDPLLLNEIGVIYFHTNDLKKSEWFFMKAFNESKHLTNDSKSWMSINSNLGHVYRKLGYYEKALKNFFEVLKLNVKDSNIYSAIGLIYLKMGKYFKSIEALHNALAISPSDPIANDLLKRALDQNASDDKSYHGKQKPNDSQFVVPKKPKPDNNKSIAAISTPLSKHNNIIDTSTDDADDISGEFFRKTSKILSLSKSTLSYKKVLSKSPRYDFTANSPSIVKTKNFPFASNKSFENINEEFEFGESSIAQIIEGDNTTIPTTRKAKSLAILDEGSDPREIARELIQGTVSSDDEDEEEEEEDDVMDIESD